MLGPESVLATLAQGVGVSEPIARRATPVDSGRKGLSWDALITAPHGRRLGGCAGSGYEEVETEGTRGLRGGVPRIGAGPPPKL